MSSLLAGMHSDGLRVQVFGSSTDLESLAVVGTIRGVVPLAVAARNGPGTGVLTFSPSPPTLQWQAPGGTPGAPVVIPSDGSYLVEDGADPSKYVRVQVVSAYLPSSAAQASVFAVDRFNELGPDDVTATEAAAGTVDVLQLSLVNVSSDRIANLKAWLGTSHAGLALSPDNVTYSSPTAEGAALALGAVAKGGSATLYLKRTITAGASPAAATLNQLELSWDGL